MVSIDNFTNTHPSLLVQMHLLLWQPFVLLHVHLLIVFLLAYQSLSLLVQYSPLCLLLADVALYAEHQ